MKEGLSAEELFVTGDGLAYDDFIILPGCINFKLNQVELGSRLTRKIILKTPFVLAPGVSSADTAIRAALAGGIGFIDDTTLTAQDQAKQVEKVKSYEYGFIREPVCLSAESRVADLKLLKYLRGFSGYPITKDGRPGSQLLGIVTARDVDLRYAEFDSTKLEVFMTPLDQLVVVKEGVSLAEAVAKLEESRKARLPVLNEAGELVALVSRTDLRKNQNYANASKDEQGRLRVGAALRRIRSTEELRSAMWLLSDAGVDVVLLELAENQLESVQWAKQNLPHIELIAGNVVTLAQARHYIVAGADALKVGRSVDREHRLRRQDHLLCGSSSSAVGRASATAVYKVAEFATRASGLPVLADDATVLNTGHVLKALCLGASGVMLGSKLFEGMAKLAKNTVKKEAAEATAVVAEQPPREPGTAAESSCKARDFRLDAQMLLDSMPYLQCGLKYALQDIGSRSLEELRAMVYDGDVRFEKTS
ncbi:hypothetical protein TKK_0010514 [Trichogramma kaykai]|uniref:IMP dehydrogenase n=1 Tax=Trichogramma kaykai TaxID=54128 RepID=A0ABD2WXX7_9HYME